MTKIAPCHLPSGARDRQKLETPPELPKKRQFVRAMWDFGDDAPGTRLLLFPAHMPLPRRA